MRRAQTCRYAWFWDERYPLRSVALRWSSKSLPVTETSRSPTVEAADEVRIVVRDNRFRIRFNGDGCADVVQVDLHQALDGRVLIDETTGSEIEVRTDL